MFIKDTVITQGNTWEIDVAWLELQILSPSVLSCDFSDIANLFDSNSLSCLPDRTPCRSTCNFGKRSKCVLGDATRWVFLSSSFSSIGGVSRI